MATKADQIAKAMNRAASQDYERVGNEIADALGVGLYWAGTASQKPSMPSAEVWQIRNGKWVRRIGQISRGVDDVWRS